MKKTREEINRECAALDQFCKSIPLESFRKNTISKGNMKEYTHKEIRDILLVFKHNFEANADNRSSDCIIDTIHDPTISSRAMFPIKELKRRLLNLKHCLEITCDYYCSDSMIDKYLK